MGTISFNPMLTQSPQDTFLLESQGYIQGLMYDDPVAFQLMETGIIASGVSGSVYAGTGVQLSVNAIDKNLLGPQISIAANNAGMDGFIVGNKLYNGTLVPGNSAPVVVAGQTATLVKFGSGARIAVACDPTLAAALDGNSINQQVSWDFANQKLVAYSAGAGALAAKVLSVNSNSKIISTASGVTWTTGTAAIIQI